MSTARNYQTVRLAKGKHRSPDDGVCVMELASMLADWSFSDRVHCVDPAIAAFLWGYNDHIDDDLRQDLYRCAAVVLNSRRGEELTERRAEMCRIWAHQAQAVRRWRLPWRVRFRRRGGLDLADCEFAGIYAARMTRVDRAWHTWTLSFIDMLASLGSEGEELTTPAYVPALPAEPEEGVRALRSSDALVGSAR